MSMRNQAGLKSQRMVTDRAATDQFPSLKAEAFCRSITAMAAMCEPALDLCYDLGGDKVRHTVYGERLAEFMRPAVAHLKTAFNDPPGLKVISIDGNAVPFKLPKPFWSWNTIDHQGYIVGFDTDRYTIHYDAMTLSFRMLDRKERLAIHWVREMSSVPYWERSFPLRTLLHWHFRDSPMQPMHAAAVGKDGKAVLLAAKGGSGKSTTALRCLLSGLDYLGDDFIIADCDNHKVFSMYNVVKLLPDDVTRFPEFEGYLNPLAEDQEKSHIFLNEIYPEQMKRSAGIHGILVPRIAPGSRDTTVSAISREEVLAALTTSTFYLLRGSNNRAYAKIEKPGRQCTMPVPESRHRPRTACELNLTNCDR